MDSAEAEELLAGLGFNLVPRSSDKGRLSREGGKLVDESPGEEVKRDGG